MIVMAKPSREAIVVGLCAHGLDLVHALAREGIKVHALESKRNLPGVRTELATVHLVKDISGPGLVPSILAVAEEMDGRELPVLLLTNDKMVFAAAAGMQLLQQKVMVSWSRSHQLVSTLLLKDNLPDLCARSGLNYPRSAIVSSTLPEETRSAVEQLRFPIMAKPVKPMASFKAVLLQSPEDLLQHIANHKLDLPIVVQEWVPGDVTSLKFCAIYFDEGHPVTHFEGRKLDTLPRGTGTTTVAEGIDAPELYEAALRFFNGLKISGPVSLEFKEDPSGALWVIEPTAFRTDYWAGCCIANGVNLPLVEYCHQAGIPAPGPAPRSGRVWVDLERNPASLLTALRLRPGVVVSPWRLALTYASIRDPRPLLNLIVQWISRLRASLTRRIARASL